MKNHNIYIYIYIYIYKQIRGEENNWVTKKGIPNYSFTKNKNKNK